MLKHRSLYGPGQKMLTWPSVNVVLLINYSNEMSEVADFLPLKYEIFCSPDTDIRDIFSIFQTHPEALSMCISHSYSAKGWI